MKRSHFKKSVSKYKKFEEYIDLGIEFPYTLIKASQFKIIISALQIKNEIIEFIKIYESYKPKVVLEIGTAKGGTLFLLSRFASSDAHIISLDLPGGKFGGGYTYWRGKFYKNFISNKQKMSLIRANSHDYSTLNKVKKVLKKEEIDVLFIDGDHTYEGVRKDYEMYSPLVKKNGIIAFHDIVIHPSHVDCHVYKFWNQIKKKFEFKEIIEDTNQGTCGIGVIYNYSE
ncbi:MAG: class I SAM-dependent methyltransferase [Candidatus Hermodarchaeota archaeon]